MKIRSIYLALVTVLLSHIAFAQLIQTNGRNDPQIARQPNVLPETVQSRPPNQRRMQAESLSRLDPPGAKRMQLQSPDEPLILNRIQKGPGSLRRMSSPQSQTFVIDTATEWSTTGGWRHLYSFDANGKMTSDLTQYRKSTIWVDTLRSAYTYDEDGNILSYSRDSWSSGQWKIDARGTYTYDASNNRLSDLFERWENGQWVAKSRHTYTYDAGNNMLSDLDEVYSDGQWGNFTRYTCTYADNNMVSDLRETWDFTRWRNDQRDTYTYDASNHVLSDVCEVWDWYNDKWFTEWRDTYTYDAGSRLVSELYEKLTDAQWVNYRRREYIYDAQENMTAIWSYGWFNSSWTTLSGWDPLSTYYGKYLTCSDGGGNSHSYSFCYTILLTYRAILAEERVQVWQELRLFSSGAFTSSLESIVATFDGISAKVIRATADTVFVLVPSELVKNRTLTQVIPDTATREVAVVVRVIRGAGDTVKVIETRVLFVPPRLLIHDQVTSAAPPLLHGVLQNKGWGSVATFMFLGYTTDGTAAVRLTNTSTTFPPPIELLAKVISPPPVTRFDATDWPSVGNLLSVGISNAAIQFPIDKNGWYIVVVMGGPLPNPPVYPGGADSQGPFPAQFQIHLAGNVGLPRKLINDVPEPPRGIRLDTYFNHPAPRTETLTNNVLVAGQWAQMGLFKFANPVSISRFPVAVLIPPALEGFPIGTPPVRAAGPLIMGQLPNQSIDITVPMATTPGAANPVPGTVIDLAQVPIPASVLGQGAPAGVAMILGSRDSSGVTLPYAASAGTISSLVVDMGSGNEIVDGSGPDFRVIALSGTYDVAVSNTPFSLTFVPVGSRTGQHEFDLAGTGLTSARYVRLAVNTGTASFDAVEALNLFTDQIHPTAGPLADAGWATITVRRGKAPPTSLDPFLELIGPDGSSLGKNDSGFGDDLEPTRSDAALVKMQLNQQGFYRFLGRGYDVRPDATAFGRFNARLETAGQLDAQEILVSAGAEDLTAAQRQGTISLPRQRDSYLFQASAGTTVHIVVNGAGSSPLADPLVELYDPEDFLIAANDDYAGRGKNSLISVPLHTTGRSYPDPSTYRIVVMGMDKTTGVTSPLSNSMCFVRGVNGGTYELKVFTGSLSGEVLAPTVTGISPDAAVQGATGVNITLNGTNYVSGANVTFSGSGISVKTISFVSASQLKVAVDVGASAATGKRDVTVTNPDGKSVTAAGLFDVRASLGSVSLTWDTPDSNMTLAPPNNLQSAWSGGGPTTMGSATVARTRTLKGFRSAPQSARTKADALTAAVRVLVAAIDEVEPNNTIAQAQRLTGDTLIVVDGQAEVRDSGDLEGTEYDDIEDLFTVTTVLPGLFVVLDGFGSDCDLFLLDPQDTTYVAWSLSLGATGPEVIDLSDLPSGTYLIGVSIYDPDPLGPDSTTYTLMLWGKFAGGGPSSLSSYSLYRSTVPNARQTGSQIGSVAAGTRHWMDAVPHAGRFYYQVTAKYGEVESAPSNETTALVTFVPSQKTPLPSSFVLLQNYPNPFNPSTTITYELPKSSDVRLTVVDLLGRELSVLVNERMEAGVHKARFDGTGLSSGVYLYRLRAGDFLSTKKMLVLK